MSRRRKPAVASYHDRQSTNNVIGKILIVLGVLWGLFLLWRLVIAQLTAPAATQVQSSNLRTKVRPSVQKVLIDNRPDMQLYNVEYLLVFLADENAGEASFLQAALSQYKEMNSEQQAVTLFVCLPPLLSKQKTGSGGDCARL